MVDRGVRHAVLATGVVRCRMPSLVQRLEQLNWMVAHHAEAVSRLEEIREEILREPELGGEMHAELAAIDDDIARFKEALEARTRERDDVLAEINRRKR